MIEHSQATHDHYQGHTGDDASNHGRRRRTARTILDTLRPRVKGLNHGVRLDETFAIILEGCAVTKVCGTQIQHCN